MRKAPITAAGSYDLVIVLSLKLGRNWQLAEDLKKRMDYAISLYKNGSAKRLMTTGRWAIWYDWLRIKPPVTEAVAMKKYLVAKGVPDKDILMEQYSKDTVGNIFSIKKVLERKKFESVLMICAKPHFKRVKMLCERIFNSMDGITIQALDAPHFHVDATGNEAEIMRQHAEMIDEMLVSRRKNPYYRIYRHPHYQQQCRALRKLMMVEPRILQAHPSIAPDVADRLLARSLGKEA